MTIGATVGLAYDNPQLARARELFRRVINEHSDVVSTSAMIADRVEQRICTSGPGTGPITEGMIAQQFGVGRRVVRQASRILRQRGILTPRRGGNGLGGLWVMPPSLPETISTVYNELDLHSRSNAEYVGEAVQWLLPTLDDRGGPLPEMVRTMLRRDKVALLAQEPAPQGNLAEWLAGRLLDELTLANGGKVALGALPDIASDYGVSLEVAVEAVRVLADAQKVEVRRGRGGGVFSNEVGPGRALHVTNAYLAAAEVTPDECRDVLDRINTGMIEIARLRRTTAKLDRIRGSFHQMQHARNGTDLGRAWYGFIRDIADMASNPVLHFLARAMASSILMRRTRSAELPDAAARELLAASAQILAHLDLVQEAPVVTAQSRCQKALENYW